MKTRQQWLEMIGTPQNYAFPQTRTRVKKYDHPDFEHASLLAAAYYKEHPERALVVNHAAGHRPPQYAKDAGYGFLDHWLKGKE